MSCFCLFSNRTTAVSLQLSAAFVARFTKTTKITLQKLLAHCHQFSSAKLGRPMQQKRGSLGTSLGKFLEPKTGKKAQKKRSAI